MVEQNENQSNDITGYLYYVIEPHVAPDLTDKPVVIEYRYRVNVKVQ
jgi:hypothetical protein